MRHHILILVVSALGVATEEGDLTYPDDRSDMSENLRPIAELFSLLGMKHVDDYLKDIAAERWKSQKLFKSDMETIKNMELSWSHLETIWDFDSMFEKYQDNVQALERLKYDPDVDDNYARVRPANFDASDHVFMMDDFGQDDNIFSCF